MINLVVGDIHATPDELKDVDALMGLVFEEAKGLREVQVILLGDLHHTFAITNVKVVSFYRNWFKKFKAERIPVIALVGNHDMPGNGSQYPHALVSYEDLIRVVDKPWVREGQLFLPYYANPEDFDEAVIEAFAEHEDIELVFCHQEFNGAQYDNGFFAPHGADPAKMPVLTIAGHIHTPQILGNVKYIGAPRWRTLSDANIDRHIYKLQEFQGELVFSPIATGKACKRIWSQKWVEGMTEGPPVINNPKDTDEFRFHVEGSPEYVEKRVAIFREGYPHARISQVIKTARIRVRESDGIGVAFKKYASSFRAKNATPPAILLERAAQLL